MVVIEKEMSRYRFYEEKNRTQRGKDSFEEGGQYRRQIRDEGQITPTLFDKASNNHIYPKLYRIHMYVHICNLKSS